MLEIIKQFFIDNQSSIIVSLIIGTLFFVLGPLGLWFSGKKVKKEKINKAKSEFLDLIESMLVNRENITISKLITLFGAIERQNGINLGLDSDIENLLEDLSLRFARSKHLSAEQKDNYSNEIDKFIQQLTNQENDENEIFVREIPKSLKSLVDEVKKEAEPLNSEKLLEKVEVLEKYLTKPSDPILRIATILQDRPKLIYQVAVFYFIVIILIFIVQFIIER